MKLIRHITVCFVLLLLVASCGSREDKVIPRGRLAEIYAEMLLVDQWITTNPGNRYVADTSLVYEPILERYGYTSADYRKSVDVYMDDPERFSRILRTTGEILDKKLVTLEKRKVELEREAAIRKVRESYRIKVELDWDEQNPYLFEEAYVHYYDSLSVEADSANIYRLRNIERGDTIYRGLRMIVPDVVDSLEIKDTVMAADSIMR